MFIDKAVFPHLISNHLVESRGVQVGALFGVDKFMNDLGGSDDPCQSYTRR
jgi:hypothetical protein